MKCEDTAIREYSKSDHCIEWNLLVLCRINTARIVLARVGRIHPLFNCSKVTKQWCETAIDAPKRIIAHRLADGL